MGVLRQDYLPNRLLTEIQSTHVDQVISVQARQSVRETDWLLEQASNNDWIRGVVGWLPIAQSSLDSELQRLRSYAKLKGLRHVVQDEPDPEFLDSKPFNAGISKLKDYGLVYDILIFARQLPMAIRFVDRHPTQTFVVDHIAKPVVASSQFDHEWKTQFRELAKRENVYCKFSALVTEVRDPEWTVEMLRPYWDVALAAFGPARLMFGSDWPVCLLRSTYADWVAAVSMLTSRLSDDEQAAFWGKTASKAYGL
jgi:L-fuconolactonase